MRKVKGMSIRVPVILFTLCLMLIVIWIIKHIPDRSESHMDDKPFTVSPIEFKHGTSFDDFLDTEPAFYDINKKELKIPKKTFLPMTEDKNYFYFQRNSQPTTSKMDDKQIARSFDK